MNHEQIERTIEFILEHQAQTAIHLEQMGRHGRSVETAILTLTDLAETQSRRMDRQDEALARLDEILRRLTDPN